MKLNTDGSANTSTGSAGGGGLIRDEGGNWILGFSRKIGKVNSFMAETWALRDGLLLCQHLKLNAVIIKLDAKALVDALNNPLLSNSIISPLFEDYKHLAAQLPHVSIKHSYREGNRCADRLASIALSQAMNFVIHYYSPMDRDGNFCPTRGYPARPDPNGPGFTRSD